MVYREKDSCIYAAANQFHKIMKIDHQGNVSLFAGSSIGSIDGDISSAKFNKPLGLAFSNGEDSLYVAEAVGRLRLIDLSQNTGASTNDIIPSESDIKVFPNPSKGNVQIASSVQEILSIKILDSGMKEIQTEIVEHKSLYESKTRLQPGFYFVQINTRTDSYLRKIVIR